MYDGVTELIRVHVLVEPALGHVLERLTRENLVHARSARGIPLQHLRDDVPDCAAVPRAHRRVVAPKNLDDEQLQAGALEGVLQRAQLVQHAAEAPNVAFVIVRLVLAYFRGEVVRRAHRGLGELRGAAEHLGHAKVSELAPAICRHEHVLGL